MKISNSIPPSFIDRNISPSEVRASVGLYGVENISATGLLFLAKQNVRNVLSQKEVYPLSGVGSYRIARFINSCNLGVYLEFLDSQEATINAVVIELVYSEFNNSYIHNVSSPEGITGISGMSISLEPDSESGVSVVLNIPELGHGITKIGINCYLTDTASFDWPSEKGVFTKLRDYVSDRDIEFYLSPATPACPVYKSAESGNIVSPSSNTQSYDYPTINDAPFTGFRISGETIRNGQVVPEIDSSLRHISITAKHGGSDLTKAGDHDWSSLSTLRRSGEGEVKSVAPILGLEKSGLVRVGPQDAEFPADFDPSSLDLPILRKKILEGLSGSDVITGKDLKLALYPFLWNSGYSGDIYFLEYLEPDNRFIEIDPSGSEEIEIKFRAVSYGPEGARSTLTSGSKIIEYETDPEIEVKELEYLDSDIVLARVSVARNNSGQDLCRTITFFGKYSEGSDSEKLCPLTFYIKQGVTGDDVYGFRISWSGISKFYSYQALALGVTMSIDDSGFTQENPFEIKVAPLMYSGSVPFKTQGSVKVELDSALHKVIDPEPAMTEDSEYLIQLYSDPEAGLGKGRLKLYNSGGSLVGVVELSLGISIPQFNVSLVSPYLQDWTIEGIGDPDHYSRLTQEASDIQTYVWRVESDTEWAIFDIFKHTYKNPNFTRWYSLSVDGTQVSRSAIQGHQTFDATLNPGLPDFSQTYWDISGVEYYKGSATITLSVYSNSGATSPSRSAWIGLYQLGTSTAEVKELYVRQKGYQESQIILFLAPADETEGASELYENLGREFALDHPVIFSTPFPNSTEASTLRVSWKSWGFKIYLKQDPSGVSTNYPIYNTKNFDYHNVSSKDSPVRGFFKSDAWVNRYACSDDVSMRSFYADPDRMTDSREEISGTYWIGYKTSQDDRDSGDARVRIANSLDVSRHYQEMKIHRPSWVFNEHDNGGEQNFISTGSAFSESSGTEFSLDNIKFYQGVPKEGAQEVPVYPRLWGCGFRQFTIYLEELGDRDFVSFANLPEGEGLFYSNDLIEWTRTSETTHFFYDRGSWETAKSWNPEFAESAAEGNGFYIYGSSEPSKIQVYKKSVTIDDVASVPLKLNILPNTSDTGRCCGILVYSANSDYCDGTGSTDEGNPFEDSSLARLFVIQV